MIVRGLHLDLSKHQNTIICNRRRRDEDGKCYNCNKPGHFARDCRSRYLSYIKHLGDNQDQDQEDEDLTQEVGVALEENKEVDPVLIEKTTDAAQAEIEEETEIQESVPELDLQVNESLEDPEHLHAREA